MAGRNGPDETCATARLPVRLRVRYGIDRPRHTAVTENISEGGLYLNTRLVYGVRTTLALQIEFPARTILHRGEVVWAIRAPRGMRDQLMCGMGIRFLEPRLEWSAFFTEWVRQSMLDDEGLTGKR